MPNPDDLPEVEALMHNPGEVDEQSNLRRLARILKKGPTAKLYKVKRATKKKKRQ